jgi:hypothetical protein
VSGREDSSLVVADHLAALEHKRHAVAFGDRLDPLRHVAPDEDQVGVLARLDRPDPLREPEEKQSCLDAIAIVRREAATGATDDRTSEAKERGAV